MRLLTGRPLELSEILNEEALVFIVKVGNHSLVVAMYELPKITHVHLRKVMRKHRGEMFIIFIDPILLSENLRDPM